MVKVDVTRDFESVLSTVSTTLDLQANTFHLMLVGGGLIERANVLTPGDKLVAHSDEGGMEQHNPKLDQYLKKRKIKRMRKQRAKQQTYVPIKMIATGLGAFDPAVYSTDINNLEDFGKSPLCCTK